MSKLRLSLRIFLVVVIVGLLGLGYSIWARSRPDYYYDRALAAVEREDFAAARINLVNLVRRHPDHAAGFELLSRVILREAAANGDPATFADRPAALIALERAAELRPHDDDVQRRLLRGYLQLRHYHKAYPIAQRIYRDDPKHGDAHFALTWNAVKGGKHEEAERLFAEAYGLVTRYVFHELALKATYYSERGDTAKANKALTEGMNTAEGLNAEQLRNLALHDREIMLQMLLIAQGSATNTDMALRISKVIMARSAEMQEAKLLNSQLLAKYSSESQMQINEGLSGTALTEQQRKLREQLNDMAGVLGEKAMQAGGTPSSALVYWTNARKHVEQGKPEDALKVIEDGIAAWDVYMRAKAKLDPEEDPEEAEERVLSDDELQLHMLAGRVLIMLQRYQQAQDHLTKLEDHKGFEGWGHLLQGELLLRDGQLLAARDEYLRAQQTLDEQLQIHTSLARVNLGLKDWEAAIPHLEAMIVPDEQLSEDERAWRRPIIGFQDRVQLDLLRARLKTNRWDDAQKSLLALRETELAPEAWRIAVAHLWERQETERAWTYMQRAREKFPEDIPLVFLEASFMQAEDRSPAAERLFEDFVAASRNDVVRRLAHARWLIRDAKSDKALRVLSALKDHPDMTTKAKNTALLFETQALIELKRFDEAAANAEAMIENSATSAGGYLLKAIIASHQGNEALSKQSVQRARQWDLRDPGRDKVMMQVRMPQGEIVGVSLRDAYYW